MPMWILGFLTDSHFMLLFQEFSICTRRVFTKTEIREGFVVVRIGAEAGGGRKGM